VAVDLLHYRPWRGTFRRPAASLWPIARLSLAMMFRRKLFWALYALALFIFCLYFFGQYVMFWAESLGSGETVSVMGRRATPQELVRPFRRLLRLDGSGETYATFIAYQGYMVMIVLALAGSLLVGNDIRYRSLPFYLSKPIGSHHYLLGKGLAVAVFINLMTTLPALALFVQYGLLDTYDYFSANAGLLLGILGFGLVLTGFLSLLLITSAVALQRMVPLVMTWTALFFFLRQLGLALVDRLNYDPRWKLLDLWNDLNLVGRHLLGLDVTRPGRQPDLGEAALVLTAVSLLCLTYLTRRLRAVEIVN
jgi:ABC-2 type transport system permease protein